MVLSTEENLYYIACGASSADPAGWHMFARGASTGNPPWWALSVAGDPFLELDGSPSGSPSAYQYEGFERTIDGVLARRGHRVPLRVQWEVVVEDYETSTELSRTPTEATFEPAALTMPVSLPSEAGTRSYIDLSTLRVLTPVVGAFHL